MSMLDCGMEVGVRSQQKAPEVKNTATVFGKKLCPMKGTKRDFYSLPSGDQAPSTYSRTSISHGTGTAAWAGDPSAEGFPEQPPPTGLLPSGTMSDNQPGPFPKVMTDNAAKSSRSGTGLLPTFRKVQRMIINKPERFKRLPANLAV